MAFEQLRFSNIYFQDVSQCTILMPVQYMNTQMFAFFFDSQLYLLHCSMTWSLLTLTDAA